MITVHQSYYDNGVHGYLRRPVSIRKDRIESVSEFYDYHDDNIHSKIITANGDVFFCSETYLEIMKELS